jgi:hypothetical protein
LLVSEVAMQLNMLTGPPVPCCIKW